MKRRQLARIKTTEGINTLNFHSLPAFKAGLQDFQEDELVYVEVSSYRRQRSLKQNSLAHVWFAMVAEETGNEADVVKEVMKKRFLTTDMLDKDGEIMCDKDGEVMQYVKDTSKLNTIEMGVFLEQVHQFYQEWGIYLEWPDEQRSLKFENN